MNEWFLSENLAVDFHVIFPSKFWALIDAEHSYPAFITQKDGFITAVSDEH
jgi:hypothetical protein